MTLIKSSSANQTWIVGRYPNHSNIFQSKAWLLCIFFGEITTVGYIGHRLTHIICYHEVLQPNVSVPLALESDPDPAVPKHISKGPINDSCGRSRWRNAVGECIPWIVKDGHYEYIAGVSAMRLLGHAAPRLRGHSDDVDQISQAREEMLLGHMESSKTAIQHQRSQAMVHR